MSKELSIHVIQAFIEAGGREVCVCPGSRNAPLVSLLAASKQIKAYYFYEERSAAFFALGRSRLTSRPVAIVTTSGTAAVELMPAIMEAYYTGVPLMAITADRPRAYRGTNAPQCCEQVGLYGIYANWAIDLEGDERLDLDSWSKQGPAHINVCFEEPLKFAYEGSELTVPVEEKKDRLFVPVDLSSLSEFFSSVKHPLIIVGALNIEDRESIIRFVRRLNVPVYAEATSGLREDASLSSIRIHQSTGVLKSAALQGYPIDGILRIGGIPTVRLWRDLENLEGKINVFSVSGHPFSGLFWADVLCAPLDQVFEGYNPPSAVDPTIYRQWIEFDHAYQQKLENVLKEEPSSEISLICELSKRLPEHTCVFVGNSLPIRNWDLAASHHNKKIDVWATRGLSGIEGQVSTFFGLCQPEKSNWALLGDLTTLYDMAGFWILKQLDDISFNLVVINNNGGQIFSRMYDEPEFLNTHHLNFAALAQMWGIDYERWDTIPETLPTDGKRLIELTANSEAYQRFWKKLLLLSQQP